jgi:hypothetical protein
MKPDWATEHLQTIRTLMERAAVYRRALAPIMLFAGLVGVVTAAAGLICHLNSTRSFCGLWLGAAVVTVAGVFLIARWQAFKEQEPFWSPPTRRVALAILPPLLAGLCLGVLYTVFGDEMPLPAAFTWLLLYGCALHAAGFFMPRGIRLFGWFFVIGSCCLFYAYVLGWMRFAFSAHWVMGLFFGGLHLAYGAYLYLTEKGKNAA